MESVWAWRQDYCIETNYCLDINFKHHSTSKPTRIKDDWLFSSTHPKPELSAKMWLDYKSKLGTSRSALFFFCLLNNGRTEEFTVPIWIINLPDALSIRKHWPVHEIIDEMTTGRAIASQYTSSEDPIVPIADPLTCRTSNVEKIGSKIISNSRCVVNRKTGPSTSRSRKLWPVDYLSRSWKIVKWLFFWSLGNNLVQRQFIDEWLITYTSL